MDLSVLLREAPLLLEYVFQHLSPELKEHIRIASQRISRSGIVVIVMLLDSCGHAQSDQTHIDLMLAEIKENVLVWRSQNPQSLPVPVHLVCICDPFEIGEIFM